MICKRCSHRYEKQPGSDFLLHGTCGDLCEVCIAQNYREYQRMHSNLSRANGARLASTLTFPQWIATLDYFGWQCAYCQEGPYQAFEHFIPMSLGGGTTAENCVPACAHCDGIKAKKHPAIVSGISRQDIERVREYLANL